MAVGSPVPARATGLAIRLVLGLMIVARGPTPPAGGVLAFVHPSDLVLSEPRDVALPLLAGGLVHAWTWMLSELSLPNRAPARGRAVSASPRVLSSREPSGDRKMR